MTIQSLTSSGCPYSLDPTGADIQGEGAALRVLGPAARILLPGDIPAWSVTDPDLIRRLLVHPDISKDAHQHWPAFIERRIPADWPLRHWVDVRNALATYGAEHRRLWRPLAAAFNVRRVRAMAPQIQAITDTLLDVLATVGPGEVVDLRARFAWPLPLLVVNNVLGAPEDMHDDFRDVIDMLFDTTLTPEQAAAAPALVNDLIGQLITRKRRAPGDDVTSQLIDARDAGELSDEELADSIQLVIGAGHETTVNLIDHTVVSLLTHPDQLALVTSGDIEWSQVVEEGLRHQAPIANLLLRFVVTDVTDPVTGITFERGDALVVNYAAAGRDPDTHGPTADQFDITRTTARDHLAFGHGPHLCLGSELARLEARTALASLFTRFPNLRLAVTPDQLQPLPSFISNGHTRIPTHLG
ncbi:cytochrome P450 [Streptomyces sp. NPDC004237]|uniref:cytochrome P450 family protein n=1 Tax=Streptomyces sp. NPDC004237 TaxID=3154455 RepID=UPI0033B85085